MAFLMTLYERNIKTIYVIFTHCVILVHKGVWYGKFLVLIEACLISYLRGSFSIFFLKFMQQEMAVLTGKSLLENVTAQRWESKSWDSTKIFPSPSMHATYTPFIYHQRRLKKHLFDELLEMHKKWRLKHCNTGILHRKNAIMDGCKEANFQV